MSKKLVNNESIYSLVPPEVAKQVRPPRHMSKYPGTTAPTASTFGAASKSATGIHNAGGDYDEPPTAHPVRQATASFGPEGRTLDTHNPLAFTRCHQKEPRLPSPSKFTYRDDERKPAVPARHEKPICGLTGTKNFVLANAVENMLAEPKVRQSSEVDWLRKEDFGKVPQYLSSVKEQVNKEYEMVRTAQLEHTQTHGGGAKMRLLSEEERVELLDALKKKWQSVNQVYQTLTHQVILDTQGKIRRKEGCEKELNILEKDIKRLDKKNVYVVDE